jgi:hypothetical protein
MIAEPGGNWTAIQTESVQNESTLTQTSHGSVGNAMIYEAIEFTNIS